MFMVSCCGFSDIRGTESKAFRLGGVGGLWLEKNVEVNIEPASFGRRLTKFFAFAVGWKEHFAPDLKHDLDPFADTF